MRFLVVFLIVLLSNSSYAAKSGSELLRECQNSIWLLDGDSKDSNLFYSGLCLGLVTGTAKAYQQAHLFHDYGAVEKLPCIPAEATGNQLVRILVKYLKDKPERLHKPYSSLVYDAFAGAFPCK